MKKGLFIFITTFGRAWFAWFGGWRRNGAMAWAPPPFMRENSTSSDLSNSTYKSLTNRYQYRFVSDFMNLSTCFRYIMGSTSVYSKEDNEPVSKRYMNIKSCTNRSFMCPLLFS